MKEFLILAIRVKTFKTADGREFPIYATTATDATRLPVKFTKTVSPDKRPTKACLLKIPYDAVHKGKDRRGYDCLWVSDIAAILPLMKSDKEDKEIRSMFVVLPEGENPFDGADDE